MSQLFAFCGRSISSANWSRLSATRLNAGRNPEGLMRAATIETMRMIPKWDRKTRWSFGIAALVWLVYVFAPGLNLVFALALRRNPVVGNHFAVSIPRNWGILWASSDYLIATKLHCITRYCVTTVTQSTVAIMSTPSLSQVFVDEIRKPAIHSLQEDGFSAETHSFDGLSGRTECFEGKKATSGTEMRATCYALNAGLEITYQGTSAERNAFYRIVESLQGR
jgi:hypothetical protein